VRKGTYIAARVKIKAYQKSMAIEIDVTWENSYNNIQYTSLVAQ
jgi:hypothetical protein